MLHRPLEWRDQSELYTEGPGSRPSTRAITNRHGSETPSRIVVRPKHPDDRGDIPRRNRHDYVNVPGSPIFAVPHRGHRADDELLDILGFQPLGGQKQKVSWPEWPIRLSHSFCTCASAQPGYCDRIAVRTISRPCRNISFAWSSRSCGDVARSAAAERSSITSTHGGQRRGSGSSMPSLDQPRRSPAQYRFNLSSNFASSFRTYSRFTASHPAKTYGLFAM